MQPPTVVSDARLPHHASLRGSIWNRSLRPRKQFQGSTASNLMRGRNTSTRPAKAPAPPRDEWDSDEEEEDVMVDLQRNMPKSAAPTARVAPMSCPLPPRPLPTADMRPRALTLTPQATSPIPPPIDAFTLVEKRSKGSKRGSPHGSPKCSPKKSPNEPSYMPFVSHHAFDDTHDWRVYYDNGPRRGERIHKNKVDQQEYESSITQVGSCIDWEQFEERYSSALLKMPQRGTLWLFQAGVKPVWEDPANCTQTAGKWILRTANRAASVKLMQCVVEACETDTLKANGVLMTQKFHQDMVMVWTDGSQERADAKEALCAAMEKAGAKKEDVSAVKFKVHKAATKAAKDTSPRPVDAELDSDYDSNSPPLRGRSRASTFADMMHLDLDVC